MGKYRKNYERWQKYQAACKNHTLECQTVRTKALKTAFAKLDPKEREIIKEMAEKIGMIYRNIGFTSALEFLACVGVMYADDERNK